jgi:hypothetical protein
MVAKKSKKMKGGVFSIGPDGGAIYSELSPMPRSKPDKAELGKNFPTRLPSKAEPPKGKTLDYGDTMKKLEEYKKHNPSTGFNKKNAKKLANQDYFDSDSDKSNQSKKSWRSSRLGGRLSPRNLLNKVDSLSGDGLSGDDSSGSRYQVGTPGHREDMLDKDCDAAFKKHCDTRCSKTRKFGRNGKINPAKCQECISEHQDMFNFSCQDGEQPLEYLRDKRLNDRIEATANKPKDCKEAKDQTCGKHLNAFRPNYGQIETCMRVNAPYMKKYGCSDKEIDDVSERRAGMDYRKGVSQKAVEEVSGISHPSRSDNPWATMQYGDSPSAPPPGSVPHFINGYTFGEAQGPGVAIGGARRRRRTKRRKTNKSKKNRRTKRTKRTRRIRRR